MKLFIILFFWFSGFQTDVPQEATFDANRPHVYYQSQDAQDYNVKANGYKNNRRINLRRRTIVVVDDTIFQPKGKK